MMRIEFSSKAGTLSKLRGILLSAQIAPIATFSIGQWNQDPNKCIASVVRNAGDGPWIVRSSCHREDSPVTSNAGAFLSELNVSQINLAGSVERVIASYGNACEDDEVLIQPMLQNVQRAGVAFSHDPNTCAPYRVISWTEGGDTTKVTIGLGGRTWQQAANSPQPPPPVLGPVVTLLTELLTLFGEAPVDCEFAVTKDEAGETLWLLQARPLILSRPPQSPDDQSKRLQRIHEKVARGMHPHPFLMGRRTVYGVMPDWNPAEIIGVRPKPLALSLYRELITDAIWAYQRNNYGYRNLRSFPLMPHFFGLPYIDVRLSFNSFIPADLDENLANRLADYYIDRLLSAPELHDKVEFEIVFSCYTLDLPERLERLAAAGFTRAECDTLAQSLRTLTNRIVHTKNGLWRDDSAKLEVLTRRREELYRSGADPLERIYWLLEDGKRYGTLPFAGLARAGFVAVQMLKSLVAVGVFRPSDYDAFVAGVSTVSGQLARDRSLLTQAEFLARYGHLRPGTYDLLSPRYDEAPEMYFDWSQILPVPESVKPFALTLVQMREVVSLLQHHGLQPDPVGLFDFLQAGIELRELAKFHFTKNLSDALALIEECGRSWGFSREEMAFCDIAVFRELYASAADPEDIVGRSVELGKARFKETLALSLPTVITRPEDIWAFEWPETIPNFITQKQITAPVVDSLNRERITGAIVCIPNADPGFDWLFSYPISGLITTWGGANSHMAIRAGELGLPAVIGAGEAFYRRWSAAKRLHVDCASRRVEVLA